MNTISLPEFIERLLPGIPWVAKEVRDMYLKLKFLRECGVTVESEETADGERFFIRNVSAKTRTYLEE